MLYDALWRVSLPLPEDALPFSSDRPAWRFAHSLLLPLCYHHVPCSSTWTPEGVREGVRCCGKTCSLGICRAQGAGEQGGGCRAGGAGQQGAAGARAQGAPGRVRAAHRVHPLRRPGPSLGCAGARPMTPCVALPRSIDNTLYSV
jgi:hypothetical protein